MSWSLVEGDNADDFVGFLIARRTESPEYTTTLLITLSHRGYEAGSVRWLPRTQLLGSTLSASGYGLT
jgi:hypothetical protein